MKQKVELSKQEIIILVSLVRGEIEALEKKADPVLREHTRVYESECRELLEHLKKMAGGL